MTSDHERYSDRPLPPYSYVPGLSPHPVSDPRGHSFGVHEPSAQALDEATYRSNATYLYAIDLFNYGYYWEAHEAWEALWHAAGRNGTAADFLKGLIKLAAAGVKMREGRSAGVKQHAERAAQLFGGVANSAAAREMCFGLSLSDLVATAGEMARNAEVLAGDASANASQMLPAVLRLD